MLTFFDPVALDDIDIHHNSANFYIIQVDATLGHEKYKICGTVSDLNSPQMLFDPITKIQTYWLITREQLNHANLSLLFPKDKLRDEPLSITELDECFHFDPMSLPEKFGPKPTEEILHFMSPLSMYRYDQLPWDRYRNRRQQRVLPIHQDTQRLIDLNLMTIDEARLLSKDAAESLCTPEIVTLIQDGKLSLNEAKALTPHNRARLVFLHGLVSNTITAQAIIDLQLNDGKVSCLREQGIQLLIHGGQLTVPQALRLTHEEVQILNKPPVYNLILQHQITVSQAKALSSQQMDSIRSGHADEVLQHLPQDDDLVHLVSGCRMC